MNIPETLKALRSRPLFVMKLDVKKPEPVGVTPAVTRRITVVSGGVFEDERLSGVVLEGGADWQDVRDDHSIGLDVRLLLKTTDDALIAMKYTGVRHGPRDVIKKLEAGESVDAGSYYFRTLVNFETASSRYSWLNTIVAVGIGHRAVDGPTYSLFEIL